MRSMPWLAATSLFFVACSGTTSDEGCPEGQVAGDDGQCMVEDSGDTDTDTDEGPTEPEFSVIAVSFTVDALPSDNIIKLTCDERVLFEESNFTYRTTHTREFRVLPNEECSVTLTDHRGGRLFGGTLFVCSEPESTWEGRRAKSFTTDTVTTFACTEGCVDPIAENYDESANLDDGSCEYIPGCTNPDAINYDPTATQNDGTCDFGGFGPVVVTVYTDDNPNDTKVSIVCADSEALSMSGEDERWGSWSTQSAKTLVDAGFECEVVVSDTVGDMGPSGTVHVCGDRAVAWERTAAGGGPYDRVVGTFTTEPCSGCTDPVAENFDTEAKVDDGSCTYSN